MPLAICPLWETFPRRCAGRGRDLRAVHEAGEGEGEDEGQDGLHEEVDLEECGLEGGELGAGEYAVCGCTCDEALEDVGTEEGALGEDVVGCWEEEFEVEARGGHGAVVRCW
jgi:hypothetical protein